jgi:hypothetical protein
MSHLREIMKRLGVRSSGAGGDHPDHVATYARHLDACSAPMLQYEWSWWEQHLEALELCLAQPQMLATLGGASRVRQLLEDGEQCRDRLRQRLDQLGLEPGRLHGPVLAGEHAWELTQAEICRKWGIGGPDVASVDGMVTD